MRSSQKSGRSRGKGNRNKGGGNVGHSANRVYDSAGPEGKVRGTPQQIIDKYQTLARDAQLSGDRVTAENFLQHAEHYARILISVQEAQAERQAQQQAQQQRQGGEGDDRSGADDQPREGRRQNRSEGKRSGDGDDQPAADGLAAFAAEEVGDAGIVETPESQERSSRPRTRRPRPKPQATEGETAAEAPSGDASVETAAE